MQRLPGFRVIARPLPAASTAGPGVYAWDARAQRYVPAGEGDEPGEPGEASEPDVPGVPAPRPPAPAADTSPEAPSRS